MTARNWLTAAVLLLASTPALFAQNLKPGVVDMTAQGGASTITGAVGQIPTYSFGFSAAYNVVHHVAIGPEYTYNILGTSIPNVNNNQPLAQNLQQFGGLVRVSLRDRKSKFVPYLLGSGGLIVEHAPAALTSSVRVSIPGTYATGGGGVSIFLKYGFGVRPELRCDYEHLKNSTTSAGATSIVGNSTNLHGTLGIFYQW